MPSSSVNTSRDPAAQEQQQHHQSSSAPSPGPRASKFISLWEHALAATLRTISYDAFAACFPTVAAHAPDSLRGMHAALIDRLATFAKTDFDVILAERSVVPNLNALDTLIGEAIARRAATAGSAQPAIAPHQLPPAALLTARLAPQLAHEQSQLNARLQTLQGQNARLADAMATQRAEMEALLAGASSAADDLQNAIDALAVDTSVASLLADSSAADQEMVTMMGD